MTQDRAHLTGFTILVVEDEPLIAIDICLSLEEAGATIVGPCYKVSDALTKLDVAGPDTPVDAAVLDVDLGDQTSGPVADVLTRSGTPFLFHTGGNSAPGSILESYDAPIVRKPASMRTLVESLSRLLQV